MYFMSCTLISVKFQACNEINSDKKQLQEMFVHKSKFIAFDKDKKVVFLADSDFTLLNTKQKYDKILFYEKSEF